MRRPSSRVFGDRLLHEDVRTPGSGGLGRFQVQVVGQRHHQDVEFQIEQGTPVADGPGAEAVGHRPGQRLVQVRDRHHLGALGGGEADRVAIARLARAGDSDA